LTISVFKKLLAIIIFLARLFRAKVFEIWPRRGDLGDPLLPGISGGGSSQCQLRIDPLI